MFVPTGYGGVISPRDPQVGRKRRYNVTLSPAGDGGSDIASGEGLMIGPGGRGGGARGSDTGSGRSTFGPGGVMVHSIS